MSETPKATLPELVALELSSKAIKNFMTPYDNSKIKFKKKTKTQQEKLRSLLESQCGI